MKSKLTKLRLRLLADMFDYSDFLTDLGVWQSIGNACRRWMEHHDPDICFYWFLGFLGGRSYNRFLDYGLLLLKLRIAPP